MENAAPILVITCAAIAREVNEIKKLGQWSQMDLQAITADLHSRPEKIAPAVAAKIDAARERQQEYLKVVNAAIKAEEAEAEAEKSASPLIWKRG